MNLTRVRIRVLERVEKGDEAVASRVLAGLAVVAPVDDVLEQRNLVGGSLAVARGGLDDLERDMAAQPVSPQWLAPSSRHASKNNRVSARNKHVPSEYDPEAENG